MPYQTVPNNVKLYYERRGDGPPLLLITGCSDASDPADTSATDTESPGDVLPVEPDGGIGGPTATEEDLTEQGTPPPADLVVSGLDYYFEGLPAEVAAGTTVSFTNASAVEAHELVLFRLPDDETRPVEEVWPTFVVGDGTLTEPGRYIAICFLPVGGDPVEILEGDGPPESDDPPHAAEGMVTDFVVS